MLIFISSRCGQLMNRPLGTMYSLSLYMFWTDKTVSELGPLREGCWREVTRGFSECKY